MNSSLSRRARPAALALAAAAATALCLLVASAQAASPTLGLTATDATVGATVKATAQLSGSASASGQIFFAVFGPSDPTCTGSALAESSTAVSGDGSYDSASFSPPTAGSYRWSASYPGDVENDPVAAPCAAISTVAKASPGMIGDASDATVGGTIHDEVTLTGGFSVTGNVTFAVFAPGDTSCATPLATNAVPVTAGQAQSPNFVTGQAGAFRWTASYPGDANNEAVALPCNAVNQTSTVAKASPAMTGDASDATAGGTIHDEATLTGGFSPSGTVTFSVFAPGDTSCATPLATNAVAVVGGQAKSPNFVTAQAGSFRWTASYSGDANNQAVSLPCNSTNQASTVAKASPGMTGDASDATVGGTIHDEVTFSGGISPSGQVTFSVFAPADTTCATPLATNAVTVTAGGAQSPNFVTPQAGTFRWTASYPGDANNQAVSLPCNSANQSSAVAKASPGMTGDASDATVGGPIHGEVTITGGFSATGNVTFSVFAPSDTACATPLATNAVTVTAGEAQSPNFVTAQAGSFRWTASYSGDANNQAVSLPCNSANQASSVAKASPGMTGSASDATVGGPIHDEVTITGGFSATGNVTFSVFAPSDTTCATPLATNAVTIVGGQAKSPNIATGQVGTFRWTASYPGDANNEDISLPCNSANQSSAVDKASPAMTGAASAGAIGGPIHDAVTLTGSFSPSGQVTFSVFAPADTACATPLETSAVAVVAGQAKSTDFVTAQQGTFRWTASYPGDANNEPASLPCNSANQASTVGKAVPSLSGAATSTVVVGGSITDNVTMSAGFGATGELVFRAYGPGDETCSTSLLFERTVPVSGNAVYSPPATPPFVPPTGLYRWTVTYSGDANNQAVSLPCNSPNQASAVGTVPVKLVAAATGATVGGQVSATASIQNGTTPGGVLTFRAFAPSDASCAAEPAFTSTVAVAGNGSYGPVSFTPNKAGSFRWTVAYSGDANHAAATAGCGAATSEVAKAKPAIDGAVKKRASVGTSFRDWATLSGAYAPGGTVTFEIYGPVSGGCGKPAFVNKVAVDGSATVSSDPFIPALPGRYSFVASYSGDATNEATREPCDSADQVVVVEKRTPKLKPLARLKGRRISIRAKLTGAATPSGVVNFRLYRPGDKSCRGRPAFAGGRKVKANGTFILAEYLVSKPGIYRLAVGYSGDPRNRSLKASCAGTQRVRISG